MVFFELRRPINLVSVKCRHWPKLIFINVEEAAAAAAWREKGFCRRRRLLGLGFIVVNVIRIAELVTRNVTDCLSNWSLSSISNDGQLLSGAALWTTSEVNGAARAIQGSLDCLCRRRLWCGEVANERRRRRRRRTGHKKRSIRLFLCRLYNGRYMLKQTN